LTECQLPDNLHGGIKGRSPKTNAEQHLGKEVVVTLDVRDFFPSVKHSQVARMFKRELHCGNEVTWLLTRLTTIDGQLPQGAPTSTMVANLLLAGPVDSPTSDMAREMEVVNTRFVDDMAFSGARASELISHTAQAVSRVALRTWRKRKLKITPRSQRQEVTGLTVNSTDGPSVSRKKRDKIRAAIFALRHIKDDETFVGELRSVKGRINHVRDFNPGSAKRLQRQLANVLKERSNSARN
jgi:hypothetical protein